MVTCGLQTTAKDTPFSLSKIALRPGGRSLILYGWVSFPVIFRLLAYSQSWDCWLYQLGFACQVEWEPSLTCSSLFLIFCTLSRPKIQCLLFWNLLEIQNKAVDFVKSYDFRLLSAVKIYRSFLNTEKIEWHNKGRLTCLAQNDDRNCDYTLPKVPLQLGLSWPRLLLTLFRKKL